MAPRVFLIVLSKSHHPSRLTRSAILPVACSSPPFLPRGFTPPLSYTSRAFRSSLFLSTAASPSVSFSCPERIKRWSSWRASVSRHSLSRQRPQLFLLRRRLQVVVLSLAEHLQLVVHAPAKHSKLFVLLLGLRLQLEVGLLPSTLSNICGSWFFFLPAARRALSRRAPAVRRFCPDRASATRCSLARRSSSFLLLL